MKAKFTLLTVLVAVFFTGFAQQVPNGSFETFTNAYTPQGWVSTDGLIATLLGPPSTPNFVSQDLATYTDGIASAKLKTDTVPGYATTIGTVPGILSVGTGSVSGSGAISFAGIAFTYRPDTLSFDFQYTPSGLDTGAFFLSLTKNYTDQVLFVGVALTSTAGTWQHAAIPLAAYYGDANTPDTLSLQFLSSNSDTSRIGSTLLVDAVHLGYVTQPSTLTATITAGGATAFCHTDSVLLSANTGTNYTYQWNLGGTAITGATAATYEAHAAGSYTVVIDSLGSTATSNAIAVTNTTCVGINNIAAASVSIYPNPATSLLNINSTENLNGNTLQVYDVVGQLVINQTLEANNNAINVAKLSNGTYIIRITDKENGLVSQNKFNVIK